MLTTLLIIHGLLAVFMLGAITHQTLSVWWPARPGQRIIPNFRAVRAASYTRTVIVLFVLTVSIGAIVYPSYRLGIRTVLQDFRMFKTNGAFELKEHFVTIGLGLLPAYWFFWKQPLVDNYADARKFLTALIAFIIWWSFLVGHIVNNVRGFGL